MKACAAALAVAAIAVTGCISVVPAGPDAETHSLRFLAESGVARVDGRFAVWRIVEMKIDPHDLAASFALIEVDVASIETGFDDRDDHLRDPDFFDVPRWPTATVRVHGVEPAGGKGHYRARFDTRIRDVSEILVGTFDVVREAPLVVAGEVVVDRVMFGVGEEPSAWDPTDVDRNITVRFRATLE